MIIAYTGKLGSGKTLSMTKQLYEDHKNDKSEIFTNYGLKFPHKLLDASFMKDFKSLNLTHCSVGVDEFHVFMDSRSSARKSNRLISYFILQTRKRDTHLYYTTQFFNQVDKRLRNITDIIVECKSLTVQGEKYIISTMTTREGKRYRTSFKASDYFKLYDTNEVISGLE